MNTRKPNRANRLFANLWVVVGLGFALASPQLARGDDKELFPPRIEPAIGGRPVKLFRTGKAVRLHQGFKVYEVASYLQEGAPAKNAEELAAAAQAKQLILVFILTVPGDDMASAFES